MLIRVIGATEEGEVEEEDAGGACLLRQLPGDFPKCIYFLVEDTELCLSFNNKALFSPFFFFSSNNHW